MSVDGTLLSPELEAWLQGFARVDCPVHERMVALGRERDFPIVGPLVGKLLWLLAEMTRARRVFEMGSGFGYSGYWWLKGMAADGALVLTDGSEANREKALEFLAPFNGGRVRYEVGKAQDFLRVEAAGLDVVYIDVDKEQYPECLELAYDKLRPGGLVVMDNMLWSGSVWRVEDKRASTEGIREAARMLEEGARWVSMLLPLRDGVAVARKRG